MTPATINNVVTRSYRVMIPNTFLMNPRRVVSLSKSEEVVFMATTSIVSERAATRVVSLEDKREIGRV